MKLWVDDERPAPKGWQAAVNSMIAIDMLSGYCVSEMSLDHDLGGDDTTRSVVRYLCENPDLWPPIRCRGRRYQDQRGYGIVKGRPVRTVQVCESPMINVDYSDDYRNGVEVLW